MRPFIALIAMFLLPLAASAQSYSNAPIVVVGDGAPAGTSPGTATASSPVPGAGMSNFPDNAITRVGENSTGQHVDAPAHPPSPAAPANPAAAATPASPVNPASPASPSNPSNKLWPRDTIEIFMPACTSLRPQFVVPCTCVITRLMVEMPHDEFLKKSEEGSIEQDPRLMRIRSECATAPQKKD